MKTLMMTAALTVMPITAMADTSLEELKTRIVGQWQSISCEIRPAIDQANPAGKPVATYLKRDFTYDANDGFRATITVFADPACAVPLVAYDFSGDIVWHGPNPVAEGAFSQDYVLNKSLTLIPMAEAFVAQLNAMPDGTCGTGGFAVGEGKDILGQPCALLRFVEGSEFVIDHDLLLVREDTPNMLFMGGKHVDGTGFYYPDNRPEVGLQQPLIKMN